ncbi:MAG: hypothetical protein OEZ06_29855 [Myxococcales bacterium]|nr:hypothetical protein [Myxococcales bacterium]
MFEPKRLVEHGAQPGLRDALEQARRDDPDAAALSALGTRIDASLGAQQGANAPAPDSSLASPPSASAGLVKTVAWPLLVGAGVALGYLALQAEPAPPPSRPASPVPSMAAPAPQSPPPVETPRPTVAPTPTIAPVPTTAPEPRRLQRRLRSEPPPAESGHAESAPPEPAAPSFNPEAELELMTRAQRLARSQPAAALEVLSQHERDYPSGLLAQERDALRIDSLTLLGRRQQARRLARDFVTHYPSSPQRPRFEALLAMEK